MLRSPDRIQPLARERRPRVVLFSTSRDWHAHALIAAFKTRGVDVTTMRLEDCTFDSTTLSGLRLGQPENLPDGALVRTVSAGSFEAVTRRLGVLHALEHLGVPVWNAATSIERCVDKSMTTFLLRHARLRTPETWAIEGVEAAHRIAAEQCLAGPLVAKPLFGSQGRGLVLVRRPEDLPRAEDVGGVYYLQRFIEGTGPGFSDFRVLVIAGRAVAAMARQADTWVTNVKRGGRPAAAMLNQELAELASAAAAAVGASFCGVDLLRGADGGLYVLEVNSMPAWSGLQSVAETDIAGVLADAFCRALHTEPLQRVTG